VKLRILQADVQYWDDILAGEITEIQTLMDEIPAITDREDKAAAIQQAEQKLRGANKTKKTLKMETRLVTDSQTRRTYEKRIARLGEDLNSLKADLSALKQDFQRESIMGNADDDGYSPTEEDGQKAGDQLLGEANRLQDKTQESLDYTKQMVTEAKDVGLSSLEELKRQRETLNRIDQEADRIDSALDVAEKLVKNFGKRMASDKFIQCFTVLNVLLLVGVILYVVLSGKSLGTPVNTAPENPIATETAPTPPKRMLRAPLLLPEMRK
jgi:novel plant SNARE